MLVCAHMRTLILVSADRHPIVPHIPTRRWRWRWTETEIARSRGVLGSPRRALATPTPPILIGPTLNWPKTGRVARRRASGCDGCTMRGHVGRISEIEAGAVLVIVLPIGVVI